jgi:hypothetical protein
MSQVLIQQYLDQLQDLRKVSGTGRESVVREAFKDLLKGWNSGDAILIFLADGVRISWVTGIVRISQGQR